MVAAVLCGSNIPIKRLAASADGHKWMWNAQLGGLPPDISYARSTLFWPALAASYTGNTPPRIASPDISHPHGPQELGLRPGIPIPVGAFDAHWDAIGAACVSAT